MTILLLAALFQEPARIVLVAGAITPVDAAGHHDYPGGCTLMAELLQQTAGVTAVVVKDGWPADPAVFDGARSIVFYTDGGGKQAFLEPARAEALQKRIDGGVGVVMLHQAVDFPATFTSRATAWIGGTYVASQSGRGHWDTDHRAFPVHPITRGVEPWKINDGWLNKIQFVEGMKGVTPLLWSGKEHAGSDAGGAADVVAWAYERPAGGRSFSFTGLDAHSAWSHAGVRRFVVNGVLWSAGLEIPKEGAPVAADAAALQKHVTPRTPKKK